MNGLSLFEMKKHLVSSIDSSRYRRRGVFTILSSTQKVCIYRSIHSPLARDQFSSPETIFSTK